MITTGAKVLGNITIGSSSKVGAGSIVLKDVPDYSTVVGVPGRVVIQNGEKVKKNLDHQKLPDPVADRCDRLQEEIDVLREEIAKLKEVKQNDNHHL